MSLNASQETSIQGTYNVDPIRWGPHVWATLHTLALKADHEASMLPKFQAFVEALADLLPCAICQRDFSAWLREHGVPKAHDAFAWSVKLHNYVNKKLGKGLDLTESEARKLWTSDHCSYSCHDNAGGRNMDLRNIIAQEPNGPSTVPSTGPNGQTVRYTSNVFSLIVFCFVLYYVYKRYAQWK